MTAEEVASAIAAQFGDEAGIATTFFRGDASTSVSPDKIIAVLSFLRDQQQFNYLSDITAVDWLGRDPRFDVVYNLFSYDTHVWYRLKVGVNEGQTVPTASGVYPAAGWPEREVFDLFGIAFQDHPDMTRILMPLDWVGHPLRKDYPISQITLPRAGATKMPE